MADTKTPEQPAKCLLKPAGLGSWQSGAHMPSLDLQLSMHGGTKSCMCMRACVLCFTIDCEDGSRELTQLLGWLLEATLTCWLNEHTMGQINQIHTVVLIASEE